MLHPTTNRAATSACCLVSTCSDAYPLHLPCNSSAYEHSDSIPTAMMLNSIMFVMRSDSRPSSTSNPPCFHPPKQM